MPEANRMSFEINSEEHHLKVFQASAAMKCLFISLILAFSMNATAQSAKRNGPDCSGGYPTNLAQGLLKNAGLLKNQDVDFSKTKTIRLASESLGKDLWHQVYLVTFFKQGGGAIEAIVLHNASQEECSMTGVHVFVVSERLDSEP
jgi:hypothetical protein